MRAHLVMLALATGCGSDKPAKHFCQNTGIVFDEMAVIQLNDASRGTSYRQCNEVNKAAAQLTTLILTFKAAAVPFRERDEVGPVLDALEKIELDELNRIRCYETAEADQFATLQTQMDALRPKFAAVAAACPAP